MLQFRNKKNYVNTKFHYCKKELWGGQVKGCTALSQITIPKTMTSLEDTAFNECNKLTTVNYEGTEEQWNVMSGSNSLPKGCKLVCKG